MTRKVTAPTALDSEPNEAFRERLSSGFLADDLVVPPNNLAARVGREGGGTQGLVRHLTVQEPFFPQTADPPHDLTSLFRGSEALARLQQTQVGIMEAELTAMHLGGQVLSRDTVLSVLKGANLLLNNLQHTVVSSGRLCQSVCLPKTGEELPHRSASPEARTSVFSGHPLTFPDPVSSVSLHELLPGRLSHNPPTAPLETPGLVLAVPNLPPSQSGYSSPQKAPSEHGFRPVHAAFVLPTFARDAIRPTPLPLISSLPGKQPASGSPEDLADVARPRGFPSGRLFPFSTLGNPPPTLDVRDRAACDRLTSFLRAEVVEKGDLEILRMLREIRKPC